MHIGRIVLFSLGTLGYAMGGESVAPALVEVFPSALHLLPGSMEEGPQGNTPLLIASKAAYHAPSAGGARILFPLVNNLLSEGCDPLHENKSGCNAVYYIAGIPELYKQLSEQQLLPRELALRIPHDEGALLRYMRLRNNQALLARAAGSQDYLARRYCTPAYARAERLLRNYLGAAALSRIPQNAMADTLSFMHLANPEQASNFINSLTLWEHGEHFLEEIPAQLLHTLNSLEWQVAPGLLKKALHKLGSMLPVSKDDMIECAASAPMACILEMLTRQEGQGALPELERYAAAFDPEIVHKALALQMKLKGLPRPWEPEFSQFTSPEVLEIRLAIHVDFLVRYNHMEQLSASSIRSAADAFRKHAMPKHADMLESIIDGERIILRPELRPAFRTRYEELKEEAPHVVMLRYLMQHEELLRVPGKEAQP